MMFTKWFGSRTPRSAERLVRFRPRLERLESRLAPSSFSPMNGQNDNDDDDNGGPSDDNGGGDDRNGNEPPGQQRYMNGFDNYDTNDDDARSIVFDNVGVNQFFRLSAVPQTQLTQAFVGVLDQVLMSNPQNTQNAISLVTNEIQLAQDTVSLLPSILSNSTPNQSLIQDIHNLQTAIQNNPLEATTAGQVLGAVSFDLGLNFSLASSGFGAQGQAQGQGQGQVHG